MKKLLILYTSICLVFSGCSMSRTPVGMMRTMSPVDQLIDDESMSSEYCHKDKGVDRTRWLLVILATVTVTSLTVLTIQAKHRESQVPHYDYLP